MAVKYEREFVAKLEKRLLDEEPLIQVLVGPRQVGKTTGIKQLLERYSAPFHYASADDVFNSDSSWLLEQWQKAILMGKGSLNISDKLRKKIESFDFERLGKGREAVIFVSGVVSIPPVSATAIASGMIRFNFARYYAVSFAGKVVRYYLVLLIGRAAVETALRLF